MMNEGSFTEGYVLGRDTHGCYNNGYNNGAFGGDWAWWIVILLIFGWGNGNNGFGGFGGGNNNMVGYELGKLATTNDVAGGFSTSAMMSDLNDILLQNSRGFADVQQTLCQGFSGVNATVNTVGNQINQGICNLGYTLQGDLNGISREISDCCCSTQKQIADCCCRLERGLDNINFNAQKNTCDIIRAGQDNTRQILDFLTQDQIAKLRQENLQLTNQLSQNSQTNTIINTLRPVAQPAYITCSPFESAYGFGKSACGCGAF